MFFFPFQTNSKTIIITVKYQLVPIHTSYQLDVTYRVAAGIEHVTNQICLVMIQYVAQLLEGKNLIAIPDICLVIS